MEVDKQTQVINAVNSFSSNLISIDFSESDYLYYLILSFLLDIVKGHRASYLIFLDEENILYNKKTLLRSNEENDYLDYDQDMSFLEISLEKDFRKLYKYEKYLQNIKFSDVSKEADVIDLINNTKTDYFLQYPIHYSNKFIGLFEIAKEKEPRNKK